jgi:hypothetical protein
VTDIILESRKLAVLSGLERISREVVAFERQQIELTKLKTLLSADADQLQGLATQIDIELSTAKKNARSLRWLSEDPARLEELQQAIKAAADVAERLGDLAHVANTTVEVLADTWQLPRASDGAVSQLCAQATSTRTGVVNCQTWDEWRRNLLNRISPLFEEHLDMLEGAAFRVVGFDDGVAEAADELLVRLDKIVSVNVYLAVPSRTQAVRQVVARLVRMGFPGWSFWDLPLVAHEFGHIVALHDDVRSELDGKGPQGRRQWRETLLADAFATYTLGPSYAIAVLMLALNPKPEHHRRLPSGPLRAHLILQQLEDMSSLDGAYAEIAADLRKVWDPVAVAPSAEEVADANCWVERARQLLWVDKQLENAPSYPESRWIGVSSWPDRLLVDSPVEPIVVREEDLLDFVNVAWVCRLRHPDKAEEICAAIDGLRKPVAQGTRGAKGSTPGRPGEAGSG